MLIEPHLCFLRTFALILFFLSPILDTFLHKTVYLGPSTFMLAYPKSVLSGDVLFKDIQDALYHVQFQAEGVSAHAVDTFHPRLCCDVTLLPHNVTPHNEFCVSGAETWLKSCILKPTFDNNPRFVAVFES